MEGTKIILQVTGGLAIGLVLLILSQTTPYVPNTALEHLAARAGATEASQTAILDELRRCLTTYHLQPEDVGQRLSVLRSFENDTGYLATTRIDCSRDRCHVSGTALVPRVAGIPATCSGSTFRHRTGPRRRA